MASSSVSQESLDTEDFQLLSHQRRSRVRPGLRCRAPIMDGGILPLSVADDPDADDPGGADHDSPTRASSSRGKEKRGRPLHLYKGKTAKDKRRLREKRRSTGVLHFPASTESTGDSVDDDEKGEMETRRNTSHNEVIDEDNPQTPEEARVSFVARSVRNKSPSDLEADLEDNQDYDSTVSQSETSLTIIGQASSSSSSSSQRRFGSCTSPSVATKPVNLLTQTAREKTCGHSLYASRFNTSAHSDAGRVRPLGTSDAGRARPLGTSDAGRARPLGTSDAGHARPLVHGHTVGQEVLRQNTRDGCNDRLRSDVSQNRSDVALITKNIHLTQQLEQEREETSRLRELLEGRDKKITQLEHDVALLNQDLDAMEIENKELHVENLVLLRAMSRSRLSS